MFFAVKDGEALYSQQKQNQQVPMAHPEHLIAKFRLQLNIVRKIIRPCSYDLNQIPYNYTVVLC